MTPEERFNAAVQVAFKKYRTEIEDGTEVNAVRVRRTRAATSRVVSDVYEVHWLNMNRAEGEYL